MTKNNELRLSVPPALFPVTYTNGPGLRYVLWVQGCSIRCCNHCLNPELQDPHQGVKTTVTEVLEHICKLKETIPIQGITILGGEPTDQSLALSQLLPEIQKQNLSVMLYTGHPFEALIKPDTPAEISQLLLAVDILVEGMYNPHLDFPGTLWRGSVNQRLLLLSQRYNVPLIKSILQNTIQHIEPNVEMIQYVGRSSIICKFWGESLPIQQTQEQKKSLSQPQEIMEILYNGHPITSWIPELADSPPSDIRLLSPKGITGVLDADNQLHLFGFQKGDVVQQFKQALLGQGININFE